MNARLARSISMFTIVPVRVPVDLQPGDGAGALLWLPAVGAVAGAAAALPAAAISEWSPHADLLGAVLAVASLALLTRCLHLDGLADTADGLGSGAPAARALEIMRQSDIGPFGVVVLIFVVGADVASLGCLQGGPWTPVGVLAIAAATGRVAAVHAAARGVGSARESGFGSVVANQVSAGAAVAWTAGVLGLGAAVAVALSIPVGWILVPQVIALAAGYLFRLHVVRRLGGVTGDVFGALIEAATAVTLIGVARRGTRETPGRGRARFRSSAIRRRPLTGRPTRPAGRWANRRSPPCARCSPRGATSAATGPIRYRPNCSARC
jgi:adenosylcobinamide-GDP ribazoletransferase